MSILRKLSTWLILLTVVVFFFAGKYYFKPQPTQLPDEVTVIADALNVRPFKLTDDQGHDFTQEQLRGHWSFVLFGFTHCQRICPTSMHQLQQVVAQIQQIKGLSEPRVILVSVDPKRDDVAAMHQYVTSFNQHFVGLTGDAQEIQQLARQMFISYHQDGEQITHSGTIMLINPDAQIQAAFAMPHEASTLLQGYAALTAKRV